MMGFKKGDVFWEGRLVGEMVDVWLWGILRGEGDLGLLVIYVPFFFVLVQKYHHGLYLFRC